MPYASTKDLPSYVKKYSPHLQKVWMGAFNSAYKQYNGDEKKSFMVANGTIKKYKETHSTDFDKLFVNDMEKFMNNKKKEQERTSDNYGDDFHTQLNMFLKGY